MEPTRIDYIEFKSTDLSKTKAFYNASFGWHFTDYGPEYCSFSESGVAGGFELTSKAITNGVLVVLYHTDLLNIKAKITEAGGEIVKDVFSFPGGRRFHFKDPSGNELAVWSDI
ncbi:VOC family protein [Allomuricauda sp. NBRC 101325]|uniref:VOC family protein n=1 Tax=Allomuricauda sp. NBRC 101325 TaxID=1113758 RepID=UPI0024A20ECF|nr:VOC family protein [Muricauda sp. NBRC 101325]GLU45546.1 bleomycin resistance protein [Muricauda sp. NBRC 101325]